MQEIAVDFAWTVTQTQLKQAGLSNCPSKVNRYLLHQTDDDYNWDVAKARIFLLVDLRDFFQI